MRYLKQSTAVDIAIGPFLDATDGVTAETTLTISQADVRLKKNNGAWAQVNDATAATHEENGWYEKELDATDTNTLGILMIAVHESGALPVWHEFTVLAANVFDSLIGGGDVLDVSVTQWLGTAAATPTTAGVPEVDITHIAGAAVNAASAQLGVNVVQISGDSTSADNLESYTDGTTPMPVNVTQISGDSTAADNLEAATDGTGFNIGGGSVVAASVTGAVGSVTGNVGGNVTGSVGSVAAGGISSGSFAAGAIDATAVATGAIDADALASDAVSEIADAVWDEDATGHQTQGTFGQAIGDPGADTDTIFGLVNTNLNATVSSRASQTTADAIETDTQDIQSRLPAALVSGRIDASVGAMASGVVTATAIATDAIDADALADGAITAATFAAGAITATVIATDAIDSDAIAASAVTEIQSGLSTLDAAGVRSAVGLASANLDTQLGDLPTANENADALLDRSDAIEVGLTPRQSMRLSAAADAGKLSGAATDTNTIRNAVADSKNRIVATVDAQGNRTAITYDLS